MTTTQTFRVASARTTFGGKVHLVDLSKGDAVTICGKLTDQGAGTGPFLAVVPSGPAICGHCYRIANKRALDSTFAAFDAGQG